MNLEKFPKKIDFKTGREEYILATTKKGIDMIALIENLGFEVVGRESKNNALIIDPETETFYRVGYSARYGCGMMGDRFGPICLLPLEDPAEMFPRGAWHWVDTTKPGDKYQSGHREMRPITVDDRGVYIDY